MINKIQKRTRINIPLGKFNSGIEVENYLKENYTDLYEPTQSYNNFNISKATLTKVDDYSCFQYSNNKDTAGYTLWWLMMNQLPTKITVDVLVGVQKASMYTQFFLGVNYNTTPVTTYKPLAIIDYGFYGNDTSTVSPLAGIFVDLNETSNVILDKNLKHTTPVKYSYELTEANCPNSWSSMRKCLAADGVFRLYHNQVKQIMQANTGIFYNCWPVYIKDITIYFE